MGRPGPNNRQNSQHEKRRGDYRSRSSSCPRSTWRATQDVIVRKLAAAREVTGQVKTDADIAKFTRDAGETVIQRGTRLSSGRRDYISVSGSAATVTVSGDQVQASGSSENTYRVFAPQTVTSVLVNGAPVATCRDGSYLLLPCSYS
jgi:hypothetical protein